MANIQMPVLPPMSESQKEIVEGQRFTEAYEKIVKAGNSGRLLVRYDVQTTESDVRAGSEPAETDTFVKIPSDCCTDLIFTALAMWDCFEDSDDSEDRNNAFADIVWDTIWQLLDFLKARGEPVKPVDETSAVDSDNFFAAGPGSENVIIYM